MGPEVSFVLGLASLLIPVAFIVALAYAPSPTRTGRSIRLAAGAAVTLVFFLAAPWSFLSYYLRFVLFAVFAWFFVSRIFHLRRAPDRRAQPASRLTTTVIALIGISAGYLSIVAIQGLLYAEPAIEMEFPLGDGAYVVLQGGSSWILNPFHHADPAGRFAVDLARLNRWGARSRRIIPRNLEDYEIFDQIVYSPCDGEVLAARDDLPDNPPPLADIANPEGNHVILRCGAASVLLAHMRHGSVMARRHDHIAAGQPLGRVGNSGNSRL